MKKSLGRRKIEIKKIEKKSSLQVTFSKRRIGLFNKASELTLLCGAQIAILVQSPAGKIYTFGQPSVDDLINSFLTRDLPPPLPPQIIDGRRRCEEAEMRLEREKKASELHQLEECLKELQILTDQVLEKVDQIVRARLIDQTGQ